MTVGDFVNIRPSARGAYIYRAMATLDEETSAETVVSKRIFTGPAGAPRQSRRLRIFVVLASTTVSLLVLIVAVYLVAGTGFAIATATAGVLLLSALIFRFFYWNGEDGKRSLLSIMAEYHDVGLQPTASGLEAIGIPFPHAIMLMGKERFEYRSAMEAQAVAAFNKRWENYVDPLVGLRARVLVSSRLGEDELVAFFGTGIFTPRPGERPIGRIEVRQPDSSEGVQPCFPDRTPAGLYRGQSALAFSTSIDLTPATIDTLSGVSGTFCLRPNPGSAELGPYVLEWEPGPDKSAFKPARESLEPPPGFDALFRVSFPETSFDVCVIDDTRPSRLLQAPPPGQSFAIIGMLEPTIDGRPPDRWWIDLDDNGRLIASATRRARKSLVCRKDIMTVWDWSAPAAVATHGAKIDTLETPEGPRRVLKAPPARPFGWLAAPARSSAIAYTPRQTMEFELDWLDFAGAVEETLGRGERLGAWLHLHRNGGPFPGMARGQGDEALLVMASGATGFQPGWRGAWPAGSRIICDALLLELVEGGGS
jgi:hypothetical protein